jgi:hypothetical protein
LAFLDEDGVDEDEEAAMLESELEDRFLRLIGLDVRRWASADAVTAFISCKDWSRSMAPWLASLKLNKFSSPSSSSLSPRPSLPSNDVDADDDDESDCLFACNLSFPRSSNKS